MSTATKERILTDAMIAEIKAFFPRYPSKQAVTLPALHIVNEKLRYVPLQAVVEVAELLELHPSVVQDTLSFYGYFKQDAPHGEIRASGSLLDRRGLVPRLIQTAVVERIRGFVGVAVCQRATRDSRGSRGHSRGLSRVET